MSKSILLETQTKNLLDLLGNGRQYTIPAYQRDYSWIEDQWDDLWHDILALRNDPDSRHYMGAIVVEGENDREFLVIDGQQRLATLSILALVIVARLKQLAQEGNETDANSERAASLRSRYIGEKDPASLIEKSKLKLNETDDGFYQDYLVQLRRPSNPRGLPRSNRLLYECYHWFEKKVQSLGKDSNRGQSLAELLNETIARQLMFIQIRVEDELNAYTVFETLNARGLELSSTDLLKNYLFSRIQAKADLQPLQRRWQKLLGTVRQEKFPEFLRYHLLCELPKVRSNRLFKIVREKIHDAPQVFAIIEALEGHAELFSALSDDAHEFWIEHPECKSVIRERILLRGQQSMPLLFAAWDRFSEKQFDKFFKILNLVNVFTFRFTTVSRLNTNDLEPLYHYAAKAILDGVSNSAKDVFESLRDSYVDDERFRRNFELMELATAGQSKKLAKYILCRLETDASGRSIDFETDPATIEHILPENPTAEWEQSIPEQEWIKQVNRIGNLTLLENRLNREVGNKNFTSKLPIYERSTYEMTANIADEPPDEWTVAQIDLRQMQLAKRAAHVWRADFS